jgi:hypothetical protein
MPSNSTIHSSTEVSAEMLAARRKVAEFIST